MASKRIPGADHLGHRRRSLLLGLCSLLSALAFVLTGCVKATSTPGSIPSTPIPTYVSPTLTPTSSLEPTPMIVTLKLWLPQELDPYGEGAGADVLAQQLSDFSDVHPDLQVEVVVKKAHGRGGLVDFMRTARDAAPSVLPDLVVLDAADLKTVAGAGIIRPLDGPLATSAADDRFRFALSMGQAETQTVGVVIGADMQHLAYRRDLFESPSVSWTDVISAPASFLFPAGGYNGRINDATLIQYLAAGGKLTDAEGAPSLNEDAMISVFDFYSRCITNTVIAPTDVLTFTHVDQSWEGFKAGEGGMTAVRAGRYWLEADDTMAAAPLPTRDGQSLTIARGWALAMVTDDPARQERARSLFDWLTTPDHNAAWTQAAGYLPGTRSSLRLWKISDEERAVLRDLLESAVPPPRSAVMDAVGPPMQEALETLFRGRATPKEAAADAVESAKRR